MDLYEYQGKRYLSNYGIPALPGAIVETVEEALVHADKIGYPVAVKAQVLVRNRGKAGGVQIAQDLDALQKKTSSILGMDIHGQSVQRLWIEKVVDIAKEFHVSFSFDHNSKMYVGLLSYESRLNIRNSLEISSSKLSQVSIDPLTGLNKEICQGWVDRVTIIREGKDKILDTILKIYHCFIEGDADLIEVNPLILTPDNQVYVLDAEVSLDDNSFYRHPEWNQFLREQPLENRERLAREKGLQYIGLDGFIGIIANGAGLAMSTMDIVSQVGGKAANFLDLGGKANAESVMNALTAINADSKARVIIINIFGGVTHCDEIARGIIRTLNNTTIDIPIIVRLDGTNASEARGILAPYECEHFILAPTMLKAVQIGVALAKEE